MATESSTTSDEGEGRNVWGRWWPRLRLVLTLVFFGAVAVLLVTNAREVQWAEVARVIRGYGAPTLAVGAALAAAGHVLYTLYDVLGGRYTDHGLPWSRVMSIAFVSYAFNLNMGPIIGAMGFRYRLYSAAGLGKGVITRVVGFSIVSNWLGYLFLAGTLFALRAVKLPTDWAIGTVALQGLGVVMLMTVAMYLWSCARARRRSITVRGMKLELPPVRMAILQLVVSCGSWLVIGAVLYTLLQQQIAFPTVFGVLLVAVVVAVATHIPAGLGVLEATFVLLLGHLLSASEVLAAVLAYRVLYYLVPLALALAVFLWLEARIRR